MKKKRIIIIVGIAILLVLISAGVIMLITGGPLLRASAPTRISADDTFSVDISVEHNPGMSVFIIDLKYDSSAFAFVSVENGELFTNELAVRDRDYDEDHATRVMFSELDPFHGDGVLYTVKFHAGPDIAPGNYEFEQAYEPGNIVEVPGKQVNPDTVDATITVQ